MELHKIEKLGDLLADFLGPSQTVEDHNVSRLTAAGDNYGSLIVSAEVDIKSKRSTEKLKLVAKMPPPSDIMQKMFNTPVTFHNEVAFYKLIVPSIQKFASENGIHEVFNCFPKFLGGRFNLELDSDVVDKNAVLLLENLNLSGYEIGERRKGLDFETAEIILKTLAKFHAAPIAMKLKEPEAFQTKIKSLLKEFHTFTFTEEVEKSAISKVINIVTDNGQNHVLKKKMEEVINISRIPFFRSPKNCPDYAKEPFATIVHNDAWVNNFMVKFVNGKPTDVKIVDFQFYQYGSPARDVIFFLYSSVQTAVLIQNCDNLIKIYFQELIENLHKFNCDTTLFTLEKFLAEVKECINQFEMLHCLLMYDPIFAKDVKEAHEFTDDDLKSRSKFEIPTEQKEKSIFLVNNFINKNWI